ncbi:MAG: ECF transporter S component [Lachnobacterium sp.]|nr:ECF transporter S component [Lachnobacterium sp.]
MSSRVRFITVTAMLSAISFVLMYFEFPIPIMPAFIKFDFSDLPALIGTFAYGPLCGVIVCLIKNLLHLMDSNSMLVGELSNFILGAAFVIPAGLIYKFKKTKKSALIGGITGAVFMGIFCVFSNYFIVYPVYYQVAMPEEAILGMYQAILPSMKSILQSLIVFNLPFTVVKGLISVAITMLVYKPLSPILKGRYNG